MKPRVTELSRQLSEGTQTGIHYVSHPRSQTPGAFVGSIHSRKPSTTNLQETPTAANYVVKYRVAQTEIKHSMAMLRVSFPATALFGGSF